MCIYDIYRIYVIYVYGYRRCPFFELNTSSNSHVQLTYSSETWARFQDNTWIAVTQIISTEFRILKFVAEQKWINRLIVRNMRLVCLFRFGNIQRYFCRQGKPRCWKVWKVYIGKNRKTGLNMRNKHGKQKNNSITRRSIQYIITHTKIYVHSQHVN